MKDPQLLLAVGGCGLLLNVFGLALLGGHGHSHGGGGHGHGGDAHGHGRVAHGHGHAHDVMHAHHRQVEDVHSLKNKGLSQTTSQDRDKSGDQSTVRNEKFLLHGENPQLPKSRSLLKPNEK